MIRLKTMVLLLKHFTDSYYSKCFLTVVFPKISGVFSTALFKKRGGNGAAISSRI